MLACVRRGLRKLWRFEPRVAIPRRRYSDDWILDA